MDELWQHDEDGKPMYETIDLTKKKPLYDEHEHIFEKEPDPDYPDRYYLTCKTCGWGTILNK